MEGENKSCKTTTSSNKKKINLTYKLCLEYVDQGKRSSTHSQRVTQGLDKTWPTKREKGGWNKKGIRGECARDARGTL